VFAALSTFLSLLPAALQSNAHDSVYLQAVAAGQEYLDALRDSVENGTPQPSPPVVAIDPGGSVVGSGNITPTQFFSITGNCVPVPTSSRLQHCTVTVSWPEAGQTRTFSIESFASQQVS